MIERQKHKLEKEEKVYQQVMKDHAEFTNDFQYIKQRIYGLGNLDDVIKFSDYLQNTKITCSNIEQEALERKAAMLAKRVKPPFMNLSSPLL